MPKISRKTVDEHENMEPIFSQKKSSIALFIIFAVAIAIVIYISVGVIKQERERKKIDEIVSSIQNEIFLKQCHLDKVYCCGYKNKDACKKWAEANCSEENGSLKIDCNIKF